MLIIISTNMSKPMLNNKINYQNAYGRINQHDVYLDQGVLVTSSPTFANLYLTGNATIQGNLYVEGNTSILDSKIIQFVDNIILINNLETGAGVTLNQSGFEVDRGSLANFRFVYVESTKQFMVGLVNNLQPVAIREALPLSNGIMIWDSTNQTIDSVNTITIPINFSSTVNSVNPTTGSIYTFGGLGVAKDTFIGGRLNLVGSTFPIYSTVYTNAANNSLTLTSTQDIYLTPSNQTIRIPYSKSLSFGSNTNYISSDLSGNITFGATGNINLVPSTSKSITVPNQIPIVFSTQNEKIYTDSSNNMIIAGSQDILLNPGNGVSNKVIIPLNIPLAFSNNNQNISANINNDLIINANNNIFINPGSNLNVNIPTNTGIKFGGTGTQRITADSSNYLYIYSTNDLFLNSSTNINIPYNIPINFGNYSNYILANSAGNLSINSSNNIISNTNILIFNTIDSTFATNGSIATYGGIGAKKTILSEQNILVNSQNTNALSIQNNLGTIFNVNSNSSGKLNIIAGDSNNPSLNIQQTSFIDAQKLIQLTAIYDTTPGYNFGRGTVSLNSGRNLTVNLPSYNTYSNSGGRPRFSIISNSVELFSVESDTGNIFSLGSLGSSNTQDATNPTTASVVIYGGLGVVKSIYTSGKYISSVNSTTAFQINNSNNVLFNIDTITPQLSINQKTLITIQDVNAFSISDTSSTILNINSINHTITSNCSISLTNSTNSSDTSTGSIVLSGGIGIQKNLNVGGNSSFYNGINMQNTKITNLTSPTNSQDAATKSYVDLVKQGLYVKDSVQAATTTLQTLNTDFIAGNVIDTYQLNLGDRILIKDQSTATENGIYIITNSTPTRAVDLQSGIHAAGIFVFITNGYINSNLGFICNTPQPNDIVGTNSLSFTQFTGLGNVTAGPGLNKNFNLLNVVVDNSSIEISSNALRIKNSAVSTGLTGGSGTPLQTTTDQSHVTKLGTINTGTWNGSIVQVQYGGTGTNIFNSGQILFGNNTNAISTNTNLFYDSTNIRIGLGTNSPLLNLHIKNNSSSSILLDADSISSNTSGNPLLQLSYSNMTKNSFITMTRSANSYATNSLSDTLLISNDQTNSSSTIQFATNRQVKMTIIQNGNVGINNLTPSHTLDISGTLNVSNLVTFTNTMDSHSYSTGSVVITGGLSISSSTNSTNQFDGGALTVNGGVAISQKLYVGGDINTGYLILTATDNAVSDTSGSLVTLGGISIRATGDATSQTNGGGLLVDGGASINKSLYVGSTLHALKDTYLGQLYFTSNTVSNYIEFGTIGNFSPILFSGYNNTSSNVFTINSSGILCNYLQIGGSQGSSSGYQLYYTNGNLNLITNNSSNSFNINSYISFQGTTGNLYWQNSTNNLQLSNSSLQFINGSNTNILITSNSIGILNVSNNNITSATLNIGLGTSNLTTILSNPNGSSTISFIPSGSASILNLTNNVTTTFNGPVNLNNQVQLSGNSLHQTIINTSGNSVWYYFGQLNTADYCEIDFNNGLNTINNGLNNSGLKFIASVSTLNFKFSHFHYGDLAYNSLNKPICYIYQDLSSNYQLFVLFPANSSCNVNVLNRLGNAFILNNEGYSTSPDGTISNFSLVNWTSIYITNIVSTLKYTLGDLTVEGNNFFVQDNLPIIGYNNNNTLNTRDLGILFQRYQIPNNSGLGDIVNDLSYTLTDTIPAQLGVTLFQIKFSNATSSSDNFYNGYWIKIITGTNINQVRKIVSYNGTQRVATLSTAFTTQNPLIGDLVYFYNNSYVVNYYDEVSNIFSLSYTSSTTSSSIINNGNANLRLGKLYSTDTTNSVNSSSGSINISGSISISNSTDASSSTRGGTFTTNGGMGVNKNLLVGNAIGIGGGGFTPIELLHVKSNIATQRFENNLASYSYIDFVENSASDRFGLLFSSSMFSLTNGVNTTPNNSNRILNISTQGNVGIQTTTNINSILTLQSNNFISTDSSSGFLGLIGGNSNINGNSIGSRIVLNANGNLGSLNLYAGNVTSGNIKLFTSNDIESLRVDNTGRLTLFSTELSTSSTTGAVIVNGGLTITNTQNSSSFSNGGALTVVGGAAINKNLYIGGNIYVTGTLTALGSVQTPTPIFSNTTNCSVLGYNNNNLLLIGNVGIFSFGVTVSPVLDGTNTEFQFTLPSKSNNLIFRSDVILSVSGYTDDTNVIPLFNIIGVGIASTIRALIKFQSSSTNIHYIQIQCTYLLS